MKNERLMIVLTGAAGLLLLTACKPSTPANTPPANQPATPPAASQPDTPAPTTPPPASQPAPNASNPPGAPDAPPAAAPDGERFVSGGVSWVVPEGWVMSDQSSQFIAHRILNESNPDLNIAVSRLSGTAGGPVMNFNRWRGQVGLTNLLEPQVNEQFAPLDGAGLPGMRFGDISNGPDGPRILIAAWFGQPASWFFKLGPATHEELEPHVEAFLDLARSVQVSP